MTIRNNTNKILFIGTITLMPDVEVDVAEELSKLPAVEAWETMKMITVIHTEAPKAEPTVTEAEAPKAKRTRKTAE